MASRASTGRPRLFSIAMVLAVGTPILETAAARDVLDNGLVKAELENQSLVRLENTAIRQSIGIAGDSSSVTVDGKRVVTADLTVTATEHCDSRVTYTYTAGSQQILVTYELKPGWHLVSKQVRLVLPQGGSCRVDSVEAFSAALKTPAAHEHRAAGNTGAMFLRFNAAGTVNPFGLFLVIQNPQSKWSCKDGQVSMSYTPDMVWKAEYGPLDCDRVCLGLYQATGVEFPARNIGEWKYVRDPERVRGGCPLGLGRDRGPDPLRRCLPALPS